MAELAEHDIAPLDLVVVNLYPFQATVAQPNITLATAIEEIDIGGVALLRAAAKNHESVTVVCDPADYDTVADAFAQGGTSTMQRKHLALKAFRHTAEYDTAIAGYLTEQIDDTSATALPDRTARGPDPGTVEPLWRESAPTGRAVCVCGRADALCNVLHGKEMSYNNWLDLDGAWQMAQDFTDPTVAIIKHGNPCGLASDTTLAAAYEKALASDPVSAFGSIITVNRPLDLATVEAMASLFVEVVAAPSFEPAALERLMKKKNLRVVQPTGVKMRPLSLRSIYGGVLVQEVDLSQDDMDPSGWRVASKRQPTDEQLADLAFAWRVGRWVKSNAIVFVKNQATVGVGAGQMSRVDSVMIAGHKAGENATGAVMASDAFFPFPDAIEEAAKHGIVAVVQPGGSKGDDKVIEAVDALGLAMVFTGARHFRH